MILISILCNHSFSKSWLHFYLLPCPLKQLTGYDCPGCGFQRSLIALMEGRFLDSIQIYPATLLMLAWALVYLIDRFNQQFRQKKLIKVLMYLTALTVAVSYVFKLSTYL